MQPGDRVLIHLDNCPEFVISWFACAAVGAVAVTTNTRSAGEELGFFAADAGAVGAITQPRLAELVGRHAPDLSWIAVTSHDVGVEASPATRPEPVGGLRGPGRRSRRTWCPPRRCRRRR